MHFRYNFRGLQKSQNLKFILDKSLLNEKVVFLHKNNSFWGFRTQKLILRGVLAQKTMFLGIFALTRRSSKASCDPPYMQFCLKVSSNVSLWIKNFLMKPFILPVNFSVMRKIENLNSMKWELDFLIFTFLVSIVMEKFHDKTNQSFELILVPFVLK